MAPFLRDEGPPVRPETIQRARETLALEFGYETVNESGREALLVRVPKAKPDYLHDAAEVAFYVSEDVLATIHDVLLIGHEKTARIEPRVLRDHIRAQAREDAELVDMLRRRLDRTYGQAVQQSPSNFQHHALALRIPKASVSDFAPEDVLALRHVLHTGGSRVGACQYGYIIADRDHERLGRRILKELVGESDEAEPAPPIVEAPAAATATPTFPATKPVPTPPAATPAPAPAAAAVADEEEYEIIVRAPSAPPSTSSVPAPPVPAPPGPAPLPAAAAAAVGEVVAEEYEIITRKSPPAAAPASAPAAAEVPKAPAPAPIASEDGRIVERAEKEFEIFTSKPKPVVAPPAAAFTPPPAPPAAPAKTKEYEIITRSAPPAASIPRDDPRFSVPKPLTTAAPTPVASMSPPPPLSMPASDNGSPFVAHVTPAHPEGVIALRFREAGYELVEGIKAQGTVFAFAAHKPQGGRRVLVKRVDAFSADDAATLAPLVVALGADVGLIVADRLAPGTRIATWGTRLEVLLADEVTNFAL